MRKDSKQARYEKAIAALLATTTKEAAADKLGITSRTIRKYFQDPEFIQMYEKANAGLLASTTRQIQKSLSPAVGILRKISEDPDANINARVSASRSLLEYGIRMTELNDVYKRLEALEKYIEGGN